MFFLKDSRINFFGLTCSELQHCGSSGTGSRAIQGRSELSAFRAMTGGTALSQENAGRRYCFFTEPSPEDGRWKAEGIGRCHI